MGIELSLGNNDPYLGRLLLYLQKGFSYPDEIINNGYKWHSNLHIQIPIDSLSKCQAMGFIKVDVENYQEFLKTEKNIANIKMDLS